MKINKIITYIISAIDLHYILAEAERENYNVILMKGEIDGDIKWSTDYCQLSYNYEISAAILYKYIVNNLDKIIKLNVTSVCDFYPLNRNMVIYLPKKINVDMIKKECESIVII